MISKKGSKPVPTFKAGVQKLLKRLDSGVNINDKKAIYDFSRYRKMQSVKIGSALLRITVSPRNSHRIFKRIWA